MATQFLGGSVIVVRGTMTYPAINPPKPPGSQIPKKLRLWMQSDGAYWVPIAAHDAVSAGGAYLSNEFAVTVGLPPGANYTIASDADCIKIRWGIEGYAPDILPTSAA